MNIDVAGSTQASEATDPRVRYAPAVFRAAYTVPQPDSPRVVVRRVDAEIVVRDLANDIEGRGGSYLEALRAFDQARTPKRA